MSGDLPSPVLGLSPEEAAERFERLQRRLVPLWRSIECLNQDEQTIVVVPSLTVDLPLTGAEIQAYEERFLFLLLLLRQPCARMVYVTSQAISPGIIDYYLDLLPGVVPSHARKRLFLVSPLDGSSRPLTLKILERPGLIRRIRSLVPDRERAHLVPFTTTYQERDLALLLDIPIYGTDPRFLPLGTKSGCRTLFKEVGVPHPLGHEGLTSAKELVAALAAMRARKPSLAEVMVKLNEGVSGDGNALADLTGLPAPGGPDEDRLLRDRLRALRPERQGASGEWFLEKLADGGGIVEERIRGEEIRSPSVQLRVTPLGKLEVLSTHDQLLGGPTGQTYVGCRFPADAAYAQAITREAVRVGERLARAGVIGRFALDFVVVRSTAGMWDPYAIELNLRKGGTTHPFLTLQFLTDGAYDPESCVFNAPGGHPKHFVATDNVKSPLLRALTPDDLFDIGARHTLHFDQTRQTGVVFHMMSALGECGRLGLTAVGDSPDQADALYERALRVLEDEARAALDPHPLHEGPALSD